MKQIISSLFAFPLSNFIKEFIPKEFPFNSNLTLFNVQQQKREKYDYEESVWGVEKGSEKRQPS